MSTVPPYPYFLKIDPTTDYQTVIVDTPCGTVEISVEMFDGPSVFVNVFANPLGPTHVTVNDKEVYC